MKKHNSTKKALALSILSIVVCLSMFIGSTFAWFSDSVTSGVNTIMAGNLDIEAEYSKDGVSWYNIDGATKMFKDVTLWEPGSTSIVYIKLKNAGSLALKYNLTMSAVGGDYKNVAGDKVNLKDALVFNQIAPNTRLTKFADRDAAVAAAGTTLGFKDYVVCDYLKAGEVSYISIVVTMPTTIGNDFNPAKDEIAQIDLGVSINATQLSYENDTFGDDYDILAPWLGGRDDAALAANTDADAKTVKIYSAEELASFAASVNAGNTYAGYTITLENDVDLGNYPWTPIGICYNNAGSKAYKAFMGHFDGQCNCIYNLYVAGGAENTPENAAKGLFGYTLSPAVIKNVHIHNANVNGSLFVGALVGHAYTIDSIENIKISGLVQVTGYWYVGGAVGKSYIGGTNGIAVLADEGSFVKGVKPENETDGSGDIGGVIGWTGEKNEETTFISLFAENVDVSGVYYVGGLLGHLHTNCVLKNSSVKNATVTGVKLVGKLAGRYGFVQDSTFGSIGDNCTTENVSITTLVEAGTTAAETQEAVNTAIATSGKGDVVVLPEVEQTLDISGTTINAKGVTIKGNKDVKVKATSMVTADEATFDGINFEIGDATYNTIGGKVTFKNCTFDGLTTVYKDTTYINCVFKNSSGSGKYVAHVYGGTAVYTGCTFNGSNRCAYVYTDGADADVTFTNCVFNMTSNTGKAAVMVNQNENKGVSTVTITNCTQTNGNNSGTVNDGNETCNYKGIWGTKIVAPGTLYGKITVNDSVVYNNPLAD